MITSTALLRTLINETIAFNIVYISFATLLFVLERTFTYEELWLTDDGQQWVDLFHTLLNKGSLQVIFVLTILLEFNSVIETNGAAHWINTVPDSLQVILALISVEFGLYWAHRLAHEVKFLWPFHAVHHSSKRLWFWNTGRFHVVDTLVSVTFSYGLMIALAFPPDIIYWVSVITAFIGILTHSNIESRLGPFNYIFNTPELHRWHHQADPLIGNSNYGENLMIYDHLFGTFYFDPNRKPDSAIGIREYMPDGFTEQLRYPFTMLKQRKEAMD
ncbi:MAG: sterol desaturase family protein [Calditrichaeota bacterium]|nr:sterol desaturase family protein [Calditrichota bacterium]